MVKIIEIIPGILEQEFKEIQNKIKLVEPYVSWVQIDIADDKLVPNISFNQPYFWPQLKTKLNLEFHLMTYQPQKYLDDLIAAGAKQIIAQYEGIDDISHFLQAVKNRGIKAGLALDKDTQVDFALPFLSKFDMILIMTAKAGFSGQKFLPQLLEKVRQIRKHNQSIPIEVDGGVNPQTAKLAVAAGATRLVSTSYIFSSDNIEIAISNLKQSALICRQAHLPPACRQGRDGQAGKPKMRSKTNRA